MQHIPKQASSVESVPGTNGDAYRYRGPEGEFYLELDVDVRGWSPVLREGRKVRVIDELKLAWANRSPGWPVEPDVREPVLRKLVDYFEGQDIPCDIRLGTGALRDSAGAVRPDYRRAQAATCHSNGWGVIDFYRRGSYHSTSPYPDLARLGRWLAPYPYPDTIEYREGSGRARIARRIEWRSPADVPQYPHPQERDVVSVSVLYPSTLRWLRPKGVEQVTESERSGIMARISQLFEDSARLYEIREGLPPDDPNAAPVLDAEYDGYPYPSV